MADRGRAWPGQLLAVEAEVVPVDAQEHGQVDTASQAVEFAPLQGLQVARSGERALGEAGEVHVPRQPRLAQRPADLSRLVLAVAVPGLGPAPAEAEHRQRRVVGVRTVGTTTSA